MDRLTGRVVAGYELHEQIGAGGMGAVYRGIHQLLGFERAVKILPTNLAADESFVQRFRREALVAARLRHPHIVGIHDVGEDHELHYLVMDLIPGKSLRQLIRAEGALPPARVVHLIRQLADALDHAHQQGVVHRDIKPANVLVGPADHVTLVDFGIARAAEGTRLTRTGMLVGTAEYLAPEAITGKGAVGPSADLYALGVVAYELLTGQLPFDGSSPAVIYAHAHQRPPPPRSFRAELPKGIDRSLLRQLDKHPTRRFPSAGAFTDALAASLAGALTAPAAQPRPDASGQPSPSRPAVGANPPTGRLRTATGVAGRGPGEGSHGLPPRATPTPPPTGRTSTLETRAVTPPPPLAARPSAVRRPFWRVGLGIAALALLGGAGLFILAPERASPPSPTPAAAATPALAVNGPATAAVPTAPPAATPATPLPAPASVAPPTAPPPPPTATPSPAQRLQAAEALLAAGDLEGGMAAFRALRTSDPATPGLNEALYRAHLAYGAALLERGDIDGSYAQYGEALKLRPDDPAALAGQRQVILRKNWIRMEASWGSDDETVIATLEEIAQLDPNYRDGEARQKLYAALLAKADRLLAVGDRPTAYTVLMRAIEVAPDRPEARDRLRSYTPTPTPRPVQPAPAPAPQQRPAQPAPAPAPSQPQQPPSQRPVTLPGSPT